jgi:hypothetical protein
VPAPDVHDDLKFDAMLRAAERETYFHELAERQRAADRMGRERRDANQHAALEAQDRKARDRLVQVFGSEVGGAIEPDREYVVFQIRGTGVAFSKPPADRPKDRLLVGTRSPIYALEKLERASRSSSRFAT